MSCNVQYNMFNNYHQDMSFPLLDMIPSCAIPRVFISQGKLEKIKLVRVTHQRNAVPSGSPASLTQPFKFPRKCAKRCVGGTPRLECWLTILICKNRRSLRAGNRIIDRGIQKRVVKSLSMPSFWASCTAERITWVAQLLFYLALRTYSACTFINRNILSLFFIPNTCTKS